MHHAAKAQNGLGAFFQRPRTVEQISLRASAVTTDRGRAQRKRFRIARMEFQRPIGDAREDFCRVARDRNSQRLAVSFVAFFSLGITTGNLGLNWRMSRRLSAGSI